MQFTQVVVLLSALASTSTATSIFSTFIGNEQYTTHYDIGNYETCFSIPKATQVTFSKAGSIGLDGRGSFCLYAYRNKDCSDPDGAVYNQLFHDIKVYPDIHAVIDWFRRRKFTKLEHRIRNYQGYRWGNCEDEADGKAPAPEEKQRPIHHPWPSSSAPSPIEPYRPIMSAESLEESD